MAMERRNKMETGKRVIFLKGRKVILRPLNKETDLEDCQRWINDPEVRLYLTPFMPISKQTEAKWFDGLDEKTDGVTLAIEILDGEFIGIMGLHNINWIGGTAITGALIGEKKYWGKGYGAEAKMLMLDYAFNSLNLRKICSEVMDFNKRSLAYLLKCGYKVEGRRKWQVYRDGKYCDLVLLAVFKKDWLSIWEGYKKTRKIR